MVLNGERVCREDFTLNPKKMNTIPSKPNYVRSEEMLPEISKKLGLEVKSFESSVTSQSLFCLRLYSSLCCATPSHQDEEKSVQTALASSYSLYLLVSSSDHSPASFVPALPPSLLCLQEKELLNATLKETKKVPTQKYDQPLTTAHEIGWMSVSHGHVSMSTAMPILFVLASLPNHSLSGPSFDPHFFHIHPIQLTS